MGLVATLSIVIAATAMTAFIVINSPYMPYDWYNASHVDALEKACIAGDIDRIKSLIEQDETLVDRVNQISGWAPIHHLIIHNHFDALTILSADPNVRGLKVCLSDIQRAMPCVWRTAIDWRDRIQQTDLLQRLMCESPIV
jgi:hypothetical protein